MKAISYNIMQYVETRGNELQCSSKIAESMLEIIHKSLHYMQIIQIEFHVEQSMHIFMNIQVFKILSLYAAWRQVTQTCSIH